MIKKLIKLFTYFTIIIAFTTVSAYITMRIIVKGEKIIVVPDIQKKDIQPYCL